MLKDGFLYKKVSIGSVICWAVQPSDMELLKFSNVSKVGDEDLNWVSSVYRGRNKMRLSEAADQQELAEKGNGFNLHDFVLFGLVFLLQLVYPVASSTILPKVLFFSVFLICYYRYLSLLLF